MYANLHRLYLAGSCSDTKLDSAVVKKWITQAQADQIRADKAQQDVDQAVIDGLVLDSLSE